MQVFDAGTMLDSLRRLTSPVVAVHGMQDDVIEAPGDKVWDYLVGAAETETTLRRNRAAFDSIKK